MKFIGGLLTATLLSTFIIMCLSSTVIFADSGWIEYQGTWFSIQVPANFNVEKTTPVEDFDIFRFYNKEGKQILGAYAGFHPQFPDGVPAGVKLHEGLLGNKPLEYAEWTDKDGHKGEFLVQLDPEEGPVIHFWYLELTSEELVTVKKILNTFKPDLP